MFFLRRRGGGRRDGSKQSSNPLRYGEPKGKKLSAVLLRLQIVYCSSSGHSTSLRRAMWVERHGNFLWPLHLHMVVGASPTRSPIASQLKLCSCCLTWVLTAKWEDLVVISIFLQLYTTLATLVVKNTRTEVLRVTRVVLIIWVL